MSEKPAVIEYATLALLLNENKTQSNPAQLQGFICGLICANTNDVAPDFKKSLPELQKNAVLLDVLQQLYEHSFRQLNQFSFEFELLLPDDDAEINVRSEELGLWSQGFLSGLQSKLDINALPDGELKEVIHDLLEIAQVSFGDLDNDEENEAAYFELIEYVRLSVLMIYQELHPDVVPSESDDPSLH